MKVAIFVEGGGHEALDTACRRAFKGLFEKAGFAGRLPRVFACGGRSFAFRNFRDAKAGTNVLLVDSEGPTTAGRAKWEHVRDRDGWNKPPGASEDHLHFMVQCMESWLRADEDTLRTYFGPRVDRLPGQASNVESIRKEDLIDKLEQACNYEKGRHSFDLLARIDPDKVKSASPHARDFFAYLDTIL